MFSGGQSPNNLGSLSAKYESEDRGVGTITNEKKTISGYLEGASYGTYQIAIKTGAMGEFLKYMKQRDPSLAPNLVKLTPGTPNFDAEWKRLANAQVIFHTIFCSKW